METSLILDRSSSARPARTRWLLRAALILIYLLQCAVFIRTQSFTADEPGHLAAGLAMWRHGQFALQPDQPPLARLIVTAPLALLTKIDIDPQQQRIEPLDPRLALWTRPTIVVLGVALLWLIWSIARAWLGEGAADFALALASFSPALIAHFSLDTMDGAGALTILLAVVQWVRWRRAPTPGQTGLLGLSLGLMLLAKFYAPPLFVALLYLMTLKTSDGRPHSRWWHWKHAIAAAALAWTVVSAGYFFHVTRLRFTGDSIVAQFPHRTSASVFAVSTPMHGSVVIPGAEYFEGVYEVAEHDVAGHSAMMLGKISHRGGWKSFLFVVIALKWPMVVLGLGLAGAIPVLLRKVTLPTAAAPVLLVPAIFVAMAVFARIQTGDRHFLPLYPFLILSAAAVWKWAEPRRWLRYGLVILAGLNAVDVLRFVPDYLSYFTPLVDASQSYRLLTDSNSDWGEGLIALKKFQDANPETVIHLAYFGTLDPKIYGIRYEPLNPSQYPHGTVVVSATHLSGQLLTDPNAYRWLLQYPPRVVLNHSLYVFEVP